MRSPAKSHNSFCWSYSCRPWWPPWRRHRHIPWRQYVVKCITPTTLMQRSRPSSGSDHSLPWVSCPPLGNPARPFNAWSCVHSERRQVSWPRNLQLHGLDEKSWYRPTNSIYAAPWYGILNRFRKFYNSPNSESEFFAEFEKRYFMSNFTFYLIKIIISLLGNGVLLERQ